MIILQQPGWNIFELCNTMKGSVVPIMYPKIIFSGVFGIISVILFEYGYWQESYEFNFTPFTAFGVALSIFLSFRNNACYDRWWEARKLWGRQIIAVRNLGRLLVLTMDKLEMKDIYIRKMMNYACAQSHALRSQLRGSVDFSDRDRYLDDCDINLLVTMKIPNSAEYILVLSEKYLCMIHDSYPLDSIILMGLHDHLNALNDIQASCERIANAPIPFPYTLLIHRTVWMFVFLSAFALVPTCNRFTPLITAILGYVFFGLHEVGIQIENPFQYSPHGLALNAMCRTIEISAAMILRDECPPLYPMDDVTLM